MRGDLERTACSTLTDSLKGISRAAVLTETGVETPVFVRFSTVAGNEGSTDLARDVRGFATKFYTKEGNWDLVGNNIPVFFIQDALKFPDLIHAAKQEPDRAFPQAATAHDSFWDFVVADAGVDAHADVGDVRSRHSALLPHDGRLRHSYLPAAERRRQIDVCEIPLAAAAGHAVRGVG